MVKSKESFEADGKEENEAYFLATLCLFFGMLLLRVMAFIVHKLDRSHHSHGAAEEAETAANMTSVGDVNVEVEQRADSTNASADAKPAKDKKLEQMGLNTAMAIG